MSLRRLLCALALAALSGCANVQPTLPYDAAPDPQSGYVASQFSKANYNNFAFVIRDMDSKQEYLMALGEDSVRFKEHKGLTVAIKLPPGSYAVTDWMTYRTGTMEIISRTRLEPNAVLNRPFTVGAGSVTHLGSFDLTRNERQLNSVVKRTTIRIVPLAWPQSAVQDDFKRSYANLAQLPLSCLYCIDTVRRPAP